MNLQCPLNPTSLGQTSYNIYKGLIKLTDVAIFPYQNKVDLACFEPSEREVNEIRKSEHYRKLSYSRTDSQLQIWHIQGSESSVSSSSNLLTFHETDQLTDVERRILDSHDRVIVTSNYTKQVFENSDVQAKIYYIALGFDCDSFKVIPKEQTNVITFGLRGKFEERKNTLRIIKAWCREFGGNPNFRLDCSLHNFFYQPEEQMNILLAGLPDNCIPWNVNLLPFASSNKVYNQMLNNADIDLTGMSACEGFNLPLFQSLALGKHAVVLNAHVHSDFCSNENSVLIQPSRMRPAEDGKFFIKGGNFSQGQWFDFKDEDLISGMHQAIARFKESPVNSKGLDLQKMSFDDTAKKLLDVIG